MGQSGGELPVCAPPEVKAHPEEMPLLCTGSQEQWWPAGTVLTGRTFPSFGLQTTGQLEDRVVPGLGKLAPKSLSTDHILDVLCALAREGKIHPLPGLYSRLPSLKLSSLPSPAAHRTAEMLRERLPGFELDSLFYSAKNLIAVGLWSALHGGWVCGVPWRRRRVVSRAVPHPRDELPQGGPGVGTALAPSPGQPPLNGKRWC